MSERQHRPSGPALKQAFFLTTLTLLVEAGVGFLSHSLALLSDAGHILTDVAALGLAWFAVEQAKRPADARRTYGYHRVGILTAMANGATLILIVGAIGYEAVRRLLHPEPVQGGLVVVAALGAIAVNTFVAFRLRGNRENLNVRAAMLHVLGDLAASVGVVIAGAIILVTGWLYADPLISLGIAVLIAWGGIKIVIDTVNILLEATPSEVDIEEVRELIIATEGVNSVHDLHVWSLSPEQVALSCHVVVGLEASAVDTEHIVRTLEEKLCGRFTIGHTTIQAEACHPCDPDATHGPGEHNHPHPPAQGEPPLVHRHR
jgi:cobalt-zinc-cadmium efflux system protein